LDSGLAVTARLGVATMFIRWLLPNLGISVAAGRTDAAGSFAGAPLQRLTKHEVPLHVTPRHRPHPSPGPGREGVAGERPRGRLCQFPVGLGLAAADGLPSSRDGAGLGGGGDDPIASRLRALDNGGQNRLFIELAATRAVSALLDHCEVWRLDAVVCEHTEYAGRLVGELVGIPVATKLVANPPPLPTIRVLVADLLDSVRQDAGLGPDPNLEHFYGQLLLDSVPPSLCRQVVLTHMSAEILSRRSEVNMECADDGLVITL
jgi:hypothetical protein